MLGKHSRASIPILVGFWFVSVFVSFFFLLLRQEATRASLKLLDHSVSTSEVLELQACTSKPGFQLLDSEQDYCFPKTQDCSELSQQEFWSLYSLLCLVSSVVFQSNTQGKVPLRH